MYSITIKDIGNDYLFQLYKADIKFWKKFDSLDFGAIVGLLIFEKRTLFYLNTIFETKHFWFCLE